MSGLKVLLCSENTPPQVNGIARRVGHYTDGLSARGVDLTLLHPGSEGVWHFINPWNGSALMFIIKPTRLLSLLMGSYDLVHVVMPLNISGLWLLGGFRVLRALRRSETPKLVVSWHCNLESYNKSIFPAAVNDFMVYLVSAIFQPVVRVSDHLLIPTPSTEPLFRAGYGERWGICPNGLQLDSFNPAARHSASGELWQQRKRDALRAAGCSHLLLCVGRLSPEKGVQDLLSAMPLLTNCVLWLVGDGPARGVLELQARELGLDGALRSPGAAAAPRVQFWGYQRGEALHAVYTVCDCFVCPSQTETFGQTVNEALASGVPVAVPRVDCFVEAYTGLLDPACMWTADVVAEMAKAIRSQLTEPEGRHGSSSGGGGGGGALGKKRPRLKSWDEACDELVGEYAKVDVHAAHQGHSSLRVLAEFGVLLALLPSFFLFTVVVVLLIAALAKIRLVRAWLWAVFSPAALWSRLVAPPPAGSSRPAAAGTEPAPGAGAQLPLTPGKSKKL